MMEESDNDAVVEIFCVDISRSMWYSCTFPYVIGKSKLEIAKEMITQPPKDDRGYPIIDENSHYTSLVTFSDVPKQIVPIEINDNQQKDRISSALDNLTHSAGTAIYSAIKYCEQLILDFTQHPKRKQRTWRVLLHVFSDGEDNASDALRKRELGTEKEYIREGRSTLHHRFLYSFDAKASFHNLKNLGENLGATVILIKSDDIKATLEERDKMVFRCFRAGPVKNNSTRGFNVLKGDKPDLVMLQKQLEKLDKVFQGYFLSYEGIFRENANVNVVENNAGKFVVGMDTLDDYDDPIATSHALKNVLHRYEIIPQTQQLKLLALISTNLQDTEKIPKAQEILYTLPDLNLSCLKIILSILHRVMVAQQQLPSSKALTLQGISIVFSTVLFDMNVESTVDVKSRLVLAMQCVSFLILNRIPLMEMGARKIL